MDDDERLKKINTLCDEIGEKCKEACKNIMTECCVDAAKNEGETEKKNEIKKNETPYGSSGVGRVADSINSENFSLDDKVPRMSTPDSFLKGKQESCAKQTSECDKDKKKELKKIERRYRILDNDAADSINYDNLSLDTKTNVSLGTHIFGSDFLLTDKQELGGDKKPYYEATRMSQMANRVDSIPAGITLSESTQKLNNEARRSYKGYTPRRAQPNYLSTSVGSANINEVTKLTIREEAEAVVDSLIMEAEDIIKLCKLSDKCN